MTNKQVCRSSLFGGRSNRLQVQPPFYSFLCVMLKCPPSLHCQAPNCLSSVVLVPQQAPVASVTNNV
jgi:hypothetical protein